MKTLTMQEMPASVLADKPHKKASKHYVFVPTTKIVEDLGKMNWMPTMAAEIKSRKKAKKGFQKHLLKFQNPKLGLIAGDSKPEIVVHNSHDTLCSFQISAGVFRMVCSNGMVIADQLFETIRIRHSGYSLGEIQKAVKSYIKRVPQIADSIGRYRSIELNRFKQLDFAQKAIEIRWGEKAPVTPEQLIVARRKQDQGSDLWLTFNKIQENLFKGGVHGVSSKGTGRKVTTRPIKNITAYTKFNKQLWELAESYA